jgi:hypothetical protein
MVVPFELLSHSIGLRRASTTRHRVKASSLTLGATRFRLLWVLRNLGFARDRIEARIRDEQERERLIEAQRLDRLQEEEDACRWLAEQAVARRLEDEQLARFFEEQRAAREEQRNAWLIREKIRYEAMTEEQKAVVRQEDEIVSWLGGQPASHRSE